MADELEAVALPPSLSKDLGLSASRPPHLPFKFYYDGLDDQGRRASEEHFPSVEGTAASSARKSTATTVRSDLMPRTHQSNKDTESKLSETEAHLSAVSVFGPPPLGSISGLTRPTPQGNKSGSLVSSADNDIENVEPSFSHASRTSNAPIASTATPLHQSKPTHTTTASRASNPISFPHSLAHQDQQLHHSQPNAIPTASPLHVKGNPQPINPPPTTEAPLPSSSSLQLPKLTSSTSSKSLAASFDMTNAKSTARYVSSIVNKPPPGYLSDPFNPENMVIIKEKVYKKLEKIGKGGSSNVFKVIGPDGGMYALKEVDLKKTEPSVVESYINEAKLLSKLQVCIIIGNDDPDYVYLCIFNKCF